MATEVWRPIPDLAGFYSVSSRGRVRSEPRAGNHWKGKVLKTPPGPDDYRIFCAWRDGKASTRAVHRTVAAVFLGPRPAGTELNHVDGDKGNNRPENLEFISHTANMRHASTCGLLRPRTGVLNGSAKLDEDAVRRIRLLASTMTKVDLGKMFGISDSAVGAIVRRKRWAHVEDAA